MGIKKAADMHRYVSIDVGVDVVWAGFHVTGPRSGSLGASFVSADLKVRVLWSSGIVDRPSDRFYVRTITLSGCMEKRHRYRGGGSGDRASVGSLEGLCGGGKLSTKEERELT